jgi:hypothetical protein
MMTTTKYGIRITELQGKMKNGFYGKSESEKVLAS